MNTKDLKIISGDSHVNEPPDVFAKRLPARLRDIGPRIVPCDDGGEGWTWEGRKPSSFGLGAAANKAYTGGFDKTVNAGLKFSDLREGNWDPKEHLKDQDQDGVDGSILFPGVGSGLWSIQNGELRLECVKAYNDWMAEEFAGYDPTRLFGLAVLPVDDEIELAVAELKRSIKNGNRAAIIPTCPVEQYSDPRFEPLWFAAEELGVPLFFHRSGGIGPGSTRGAYIKTPVVGTVMGWFACLLPLTTMVFSGVFDRHPRLNIIAGEENFGWMPFWTEQCDDQFRRQKSWSAFSFKEFPSFYIKRQIGSTFLEDHAGVRVLDLCPVDNLLWSSDYPHSVTLWPKSRDYIKNMLGGVNEETRTKLLGGNAKRLLNIE